METGEIEAIIWKHFRPGPARMAAQELIEKGVDEERLAKISKETVIEVPMFLAVWNAMRDIERGIG